MITKEQFQRDIDRHVMEVHKDDGLHRHIRFRRPGTMGMHFDLITWPGYLCYTGDMGTYVFRRLEDMFEFFRSYCVDRDVLDCIDHRYWAEKLEASDKGDGHTEFDPAAFKREITRQRRKLVVEHGRRMYPDNGDRQDLWTQLQDVIDAADDGKSAAFEAVRNWSFFYKEPQRITRDQVGVWLNTDDFPRCQAYTHRFLWCCFALRWGIHLYDQSKQ